MIINNNIPALNTYRQMGVNQAGAQKAMEKLSSGLRINRAGDDAAGLAISEKMRAQIRGLDQASRNGQDGISMIQTAEGALNETHNILQRMRELATQAANDTNTDADRKELQKEINQLTGEVDRIGNNTEFNTKTLLNGDLRVDLTGELTNSTMVKSVTTDNTSLVDGTEINVAQTVNHEAESDTGLADGAFESIDVEIFAADGATSLGSVTFTKAELEKAVYTKDVTLEDGSTFTISVDGKALKESTGNGAGTQETQDTLTVDNNSVAFHIGANEGQNLKLSLQDMRAAALGVDSIDVTTQADADASISVINNAIERVSAERAKFGAYQNRLEHTISNLDNAAENLQAAESRIRDVDMAREVMEMTKNNILSQASQAMLAQANQAPQAVLQLLG